MKNFKNLLSKNLNGGIQYLYKSENGYGASIVQHSFSYGSDSNLWELAVILWDGEKFKLCYNTPITDDVLGYLTEDEVNETLLKIDKLK